MRIVIGDQSYGSAQLTKAMRALHVSQGSRRYIPVELAYHIEGWQAYVNSYPGHYATGPWLALCDAAKRAGYEVKEGR